METTMDATMDAKGAVRLGVQAGDVRAFEATQPHYGPLRKLLKSYCKGPYSQDVDEFYLALRIDGDIDHWEREGCEHIRRSKKERYISIDIYVPRWKWQAVSGMEIRHYLAECVEQAFRLMLGRLQKDKTKVDDEALLRDLGRVREHYLDCVEADCSAAEESAKQPAWLLAVKGSE